MSNEMEPHFRKSIAEMDTDIAGLQTDINELTAARATLVKLYGGESEVPAVVVKAKPRNGGGQRVAAAAAAVAERVTSGDEVKLMVSARSAPEPFTAASLHVSTGLETKFISNKLFKWKNKGYVEKKGWGEFERTKAFPATAPATETA